MTRLCSSDADAGAVGAECRARWTTAVSCLARTIGIAGLLSFCTAAASAADPAPGWDGIPKFELQGGLKAFWNVYGGDKKRHARTSETRGFSPVTILNTFDDYPGKGRERITTFLGDRNSNPWLKPDYFEKIVRRNIDIAGANGIVVHDIEFSYEIKPAKAWENPAARRMSGAASLAEFESGYWKQWAEWVAMPLIWSKQKFPDTPVGVFGFQPFYTETLNIKTQSDETIAFYHQRDINIWRHIDPYVDFVAVEAYLPSADPGSIYYITLHMDANYNREKALGNKPIYAYVWLRHYHSDWKQAVHMVDADMAEAMAILPYFSGAKGVVLWGYEPQIAPTDKLPYPHLPAFVKALARVAPLSEQIGRGTLVVEQTAQRLWNQRLPIVRRIDVGDGECVVMAVHPYQNPNVKSQVAATCSGQSFQVPTEGRRVTLVHIEGHRLTLH